MNKPIVIYHANCADGFAAAWCFWRRFGDNMEYYPGKYQEDPPDVTDRDVYLVDFSYKYEVVEDMLLTANTVTLLDHHKSSLDSLWPLAAKGLMMSDCTMERSGAMIAWSYTQKSFYPLNKEKPPKILLYIQDRDLWKFEMVGSKEISQWIFGNSYRFKDYDAMMHYTKHELNKAMSFGGAILAKQDKDIEELIEKCERPMVIDGVQVSVASMPYMFASEAGNIMSKSHPFAATYYDTADGRHFSLRSNKSYNGWVDVSKIAEQYGGGGHSNASGFRVGRDHELARS